jgi:hypothetical protein
MACGTARQVRSLGIRRHIESHMLYGRRDAVSQRVPHKAPEPTTAIGLSAITVFRLLDESATDFQLRQRCTLCIVAASPGP